MLRGQLGNSVVTRLVASLVACGAVVALGLGIIDLRYHEHALSRQLTEQAVLHARTVDLLTADFSQPHSPEELADLLDMLIAQTNITAARITSLDEILAVTNHWPARDESQFIAITWPINLEKDELLVGFEHPTLIRIPVATASHATFVDLIIDGPAAQRREQAAVLGRLARQGLIIAVMMLIGLVLIRKWVTAPLSQIVQRVTSQPAAEPFEKLSCEMSGEFAHLSAAIARMLEHLSDATRQLRAREAEFEHLYQFAPAAMVSLDPMGNIISANKRAAQLLAVDNERDLINLGILAFIAPEDRGRLRQVIDRLALDDISRCELRIMQAERPVDVLVECSGMHDANNNLQRVRLSLLDVNESNKLQRQVADQGRLLNLVIDHMSDGILVVDSDSRVVAHNKRLASLLRRRPDTINGRLYNPDDFWDDLGIVDHEQFVQHLRQVEADPNRSAQERFETEVGTFLFQGIAVHDAATGDVSRLWVVQEITPLEENQRLLDAQNHQLQSLKHLGHELRDLTTVDSMLESCASQLYELLGVDAVGIALRRDRMGESGKQILNRGTGEYLLEANRELVNTVERDLMPQILANHDATFWPDLPQKVKWARTVSHAGFTCLAGVPMRADAATQGVMWIARRGGERIDNHHIYLLEALAPIVAARFEIADMHERFNSLDLTDVLTGLPNRTQFGQLVNRVAHQPGDDWSVLVINLDRFREVNERLSHRQADELLQQVARTFLAHSRKATFLARLDGPTFALLCPKTDLENAAQVAERYRRLAGEQQVQISDDETISLSASIGVASYPADGESSETITTMAMARMEMARRTGKNKVVASDDSISQKAG